MQRASTLLKERKETAPLLTADVTVPQSQGEKELLVRQVADYKDYIDKLEDEKKLLEADLDHLANELENFRERGTNYHGTFHSRHALFGDHKCQCY